MKDGLSGVGRDLLLVWYMLLSNKGTKSIYNKQMDFSRDVVGYFNANLLTMAIIKYSQQLFPCNNSNIINCMSNI